MARLGSSSVLFRVGNGSPASVYLGSVPVQTVPDAPVLTAAISFGSGGVALFSEPFDGGSPITGYHIYVEGNKFEDLLSYTEGGVQFSPSPLPQVGDIYEVTAVNALGEGPRSAGLAAQPFVP